MPCIRFVVNYSAQKVNTGLNGNDINVQVSHTGQVTYSIGGKLITTCELKLSKFPYDKQTCDVELSNRAYTTKHITLQLQSNEVDMSKYKENGLWKVHSSVVLKHTVYDDDNSVYESIIYHFHLERKSKYFLFNFLVPCVVLSMVALLMFYVPPDSGEKMSLGVTVLLSFSVFQFVILERMPETSDYVPIASKSISASYL